MDPADVLAAARAHAAAEAANDMDATLATLVDDPVFEFHPLGLTLQGGELIETFYRTQYGKFSARVTNFAVHGEWANENTAIQEYSVWVTEDDGSTSEYRVISMSPVEESGKMGGERLYCAEGFVRALLGDLFELCERVGA